MSGPLSRHRPTFPDEFLAERDASSARGEPKPFDWKFTKFDLFNLLQRLAKREAARKASTLANP